MICFHVIDISIDAPQIKQCVCLPSYIRHVTGVMFFPVIPPAEIPDSEPLGIVGLSLEFEKLNVITNQKIYKKSPVFYTATDYQTAQGEIFLDRGYNSNDFFECNENISPNSLTTFKYTNRKMVVPPDNAERFNACYILLNDLLHKTVHYRDKTATFNHIETDGEIIRIHTGTWGVQHEIHKKELVKEIYKMRNPYNENKPFYERDNDDLYDDPFVMKIILRYEHQ